MVIMDFQWFGTLGVAPFQHWLLGTVLLSVRLAAILLFTPLLYAIDLPAVVRVAIVVGLAGSFAANGLTPPAALASDSGQFATACARELALGAVLAIAIHVAFAAFAMAGRILDVQVGFGIGQVLDPLTQEQIPALTSAFNQLGVVVFFLLNGHHALMRGIAYSLDRFPPGQAWSLERTAPEVIRQVGALFGMGLSLAAPVVACLLLIDLALGALGRTLPQMNVFMLGMPIKAIVCIALLSAWFAGAGDAMSRAYAFIYHSWDALMTTASPVVPGRR